MFFHIAWATISRLEPDLHFKTVYHGSFGHQITDCGSQAINLKIFTFPMDLSPSKI